MTGFGLDIRDIETQQVTCEDCSQEATLNTKMTAFGTTSYFEATEPNRENGTTFYDTKNDWLCEECRENRRERKRELQLKPKLGPPEPPDEWRFCQACGKQIDLTRLDGQYCGRCASEDH